MTTPTARTAPAAVGWAVLSGADGRATLTHDGLAVATVSYRTPAQQASIHALVARLRVVRERHAPEKREDCSR